MFELLVVESGESKLTSSQIRILALTSHFEHPKPFSAEGQSGHGMRSLGWSGAQVE